jgi:hypothetical protein
LIKAIFNIRNPHFKSEFIKQAFFIWPRNANYKNMFTYLLKLEHLKNDNILCTSSLSDDLFMQNLQFKKRSHPSWYIITSSQYLCTVISNCLKWSEGLSTNFKNGSSWTIFHFHQFGCKYTKWDTRYFMSYFNILFIKLFDL